MAARVVAKAAASGVSAARVTCDLGGDFPCAPGLGAPESLARSPRHAPEGDSRRDWGQPRRRRGCAVARPSRVLGRRPRPGAAHAAQVERGVAASAVAAEADAVAIGSAGRNRGRSRDAPQPDLGAKRRCGLEDDVGRRLERDERHVGDSLGHAPGGGGGGGPKAAGAVAWVAGEDIVARQRRRDARGPHRRAASPTRPQRQARCRRQARRRPRGRACPRWPQASRPAARRGPWLH
mmetsp:Transcript_14641/g.43743  ORF Transcript_14641/g.43743 Transcript_14641/m.43743 type:complete len:236 (-) Transcript_14641:254-961(-)